jgi:hypothetical protein
MVAPNTPAANVNISPTYPSIPLVISPVWKYYNVANAIPLRAAMTAVVY